MKGSGNDGNRYTAFKCQVRTSVLPLVILITSSYNLVGTFIPTWRRNIMTQNDSVWSSTSGSLSYIKLPPSSFSFEAKILYLYYTQFAKWNQWQASDTLSSRWLNSLSQHSVHQVSRLLFLGLTWWCSG